jgi:hypothetical protein
MVARVLIPLVDLTAAVVADEQPLEVVQPGEGAFDHPAAAAEPGAVLGLATSDLGTDAAAAQLTAVLAVVVTPISGYSLQPATRPTDLAAGIPVASTRR